MSRKHNPDIRNMVKGCHGGKLSGRRQQKIGEHIYGKSITDACLGWEDTEDLIWKLQIMNKNI